MAKNRGENSKIIFCSDLSETNNEPTFRLHIKLTKNRNKKFEKLLMAQICLIKIMSQLLDYTKKKWQKIEEKIQKLFFAQICLKRIMIQLFDYTKK